MTFSPRPLALCAAALMLVTASPATAQALPPQLMTDTDGPLAYTPLRDPVVDAVTEEESRAVRLNVAGTYETGVFDESAAEITAFDAVTGRLFVVNADSGTVDVLDTQAVLDGEQGDPALLDTLTTAGRTNADGSALPGGTVVNSLDVFDGTLAMAVEAPDKVSAGWVLFFDTDGTYRTGVQVGSQPDMVTFTADGERVVVAAEGEPAEDFAADPQGSVAVVDVVDLASLTQADVALAYFTAYEGAGLPPGVRVFGPDVAVPDGQEAAGRVARNLEPEYVATSADSSTAWVSLQENNAIATVDLEAGAVVDLWAIPGKDHSALGNGLDPSNRDEAIAIATWPITGMAQPDGITAYEAGGQPLIVTANEGDAREWGDYEEGVRLGDDDYELCESAFGGPDAVDALKEERALGRLNVTTEQGRTDVGCYDEIFSFGARSFSILTADGSVLFDSGDVMEQQIARLIVEGDLPESAFNATNDETPSFDNRSDDKGPEPESVTVGTIGKQTFAFVTLERIGGVMVFDITEPADVRFNTYLNNRDFTVEVDGAAAAGMGDLGAEGIEFIGANRSPTGGPLLAVANEVSGTTTLFDVSTVAPQRIGGFDRYDTAAQIAREFGSDVPVAYVASGENFPDALVGAALAGAGDAPVVLTRSDRAPDRSLDALEALDPEQIVVLGGAKAIEASVVDQLENLAPVSRLAGSTRYGTAAAVAAQFPAGSTTVYVASGQDFPDALAGAPVAGAEGAPLLLTKANSLPSETAQALEDLDPERVVVLGGQGTVGAGVEAVLASYGDVERIAGDDRYETAALIGALAQDASTSLVATGLDYPDALAGAALAASGEHPLLLTEPGELPTATAGMLAQLDPSRLLLLGGPGAVSPQVSQQATVYVESAAQ